MCLVSIFCLGMATYLHDIPSVRAINPTLPDVLGPVDLDRSTHAGDLIHREDLAHARSVASVLEGIHEDGHAQVTEQIVYSAQLRAAAVENAHSAASYAPADMVQQLRDIAMQLHVVNTRLDTVNTRFDTVNTRLDKVMAATHNNRILARNARVQGLNVLSPLQKTVPGSGLMRAQDLLGRLPDALVAPAEEPAVGALPQNFNPNLPAYRHNDILNLVVFYNEDFGIVAGDSLPIRVEKFRRFLTDF